jgi:hypothetical protein
MHAKGTHASGVLSHIIHEEETPEACVPVYHHVLLKDVNSYAHPLAGPDGEFIMRPPSRQ